LGSSGCGNILGITTGRLHQWNKRSCWWGKNWESV